MEQELTYKNIGIIGGGASGGFCAVLLSKNPYLKITVFDEKEPFTTLLPTGGGRCNITNAENDIKEFVKNYPRGEKFLLSVFSKFGSSKTVKLFEELGVKTYVQEDGRVFPVSNSSKKVKEILSKHLESSNVVLKQERVLSVIKTDLFFEVQTKNDKYIFDSLIIATGGNKSGFELAKHLGHKIIEPKPSLQAIDIKEKEFYSLSGISFKDIEAETKTGKRKYKASGDILFTHNSISGPVIFKISALTAYDDFPLTIKLKLTDCTLEEIEYEIKNNQKKSIKNVFSKFAPERYILIVAETNGIDSEKQVSQIKKTEKEILYNSLTQLNLTCEKRIKGSEIVTAGGVDLDEIDSKTMESKLVKGLYFTGEILNIDGFTGGFNLQNCWSTAFICSLNFQ